MTFLRLHEAAGRYLQLPVQQDEGAAAAAGASYGPFDRKECVPLCLRLDAPRKSPVEQPEVDLVKGKVHCMLVAIPGERAAEISLQGSQAGKERNGTGIKVILYIFENREILPRL